MPWDAIVGTSGHIRSCLRGLSRLQIGAVIGNRMFLHALKNVELDAEPRQTVYATSDDAAGTDDTA